MPRSPVHLSCKSALKRIIVDSNGFFQTKQSAPACSKQSIFMCSICMFKHTKTSGYRYSHIQDCFTIQHQDELTASHLLRRQNLSSNILYFISLCMWSFILNTQSTHGPLRNDSLTSFLGPLRLWCKCLVVVKMRQCSTPDYIIDSVHFIKVWLGGYELMLSPSSHLSQWVPLYTRCPSGVCSVSDPCYWLLCFVSSLLGMHWT